MKVKVIFLFMLAIFSITILAILPLDIHGNKEDGKNPLIVLMEKKLMISEFINKIVSGQIPEKHNAILYTILKNTNEACIHQQNGAKDNEVYIMNDGQKEFVYDKNGEIVKDGINDGSYNYYHPFKEPLYHFSFDISPWIMLGQSRKDSTTVGSRIYAYMGDIEGGIHRALKEEIRLKGNWKDDGELQALAVFYRAIQEGDAEILFDLFEPDAKVTDKEVIETLKRLNRGFNKIYEACNK
jgi:hypothetical protein